jgi:hypothetical protein
LEEAGLGRKSSDPEYFANILESVAGDWDAAVDGRIKAEIIISGVAWAEGPDPIQIDNVFPVAAHERWCRKFFGQLAQALHGFIGFFPFGSDQCILPRSFQIKNPIYLDQINRTIFIFHRQSPYDSIRHPGMSSNLF